jgi:hypothetical protein
MCFKILSILKWISKKTIFVSMQRFMLRDFFYVAFAFSSCYMPEKWKPDGNPSTQLNSHWWNDKRAIYSFSVLTMSTKIVLCLSKHKMSAVQKIIKTWFYVAHIKCSYSFISKQTHKRWCFSYSCWNVEWWRNELI